MEIDAHSAIQTYSPFHIPEDLAYVKSYPNYYLSNRLTDKLLTSAGGGIDIVASYDSVIRIEYTFNGEGESGFFFHVRKEF